MKKILYFILPAFLLTSCMEYPDDGMPRANFTMPDGVKKRVKTETDIDYEILNLPAEMAEFGTFDLRFELVENFLSGSFSSTGMATEFFSSNQIDTTAQRPFEIIYSGPFLQSNSLENIQIGYNDNQVSQVLDDNVATNYSYPDNTVRMVTTQSTTPIDLKMMHMDFQFTDGMLVSNNLEIPFQLTWTGELLTQLVINHPTAGAITYTYTYDNKINPFQLVNADDWEARFHTALPFLGMPSNFREGADMDELGIDRVVHYLTISGPNNLTQVTRNGQPVTTYSYVYDSDDHPTKINVSYASNSMMNFIDFDGIEGMQNFDQIFGGMEGLELLSHIEYRIFY